MTKKGKFIFKWGEQKEDGTYRINARSLKTVLKKLNNRTKKKKDWGKFVGRLGFSHRTENRVVTQVTMIPSFKIIMPVWANYPKADHKCQKAWDKMWVQLKKHEIRHKTKFLIDVAKSFDEWRGFDPMTFSVYRRKIAATKNRVQKSQKDLDFDTNNGRTEVDLIIPTGC